MRAPRSILRKLRIEVESCDLSQQLDLCIELANREPNISPALRTALNLLFRTLKLLLDSFLTNSENSSLPPSADPGREPKRPKNSQSGRRPGAQPGHNGNNLGHETPTRTVELKVDRSKIPPDRTLTPEEPIRRQVYNIKITREIIEYQAEVLVDQYGNRYVADFPPDVRAHAQYGNELKAYAVNLSVYQLIPYERLASHLREWCNIPVATGSIRNFIRDAAKRLQAFEIWLKTMLVMVWVLYTDVTSINVSGKKKYISTYSSDKYTLLIPNEHKGHKAVIEVGILPNRTDDQIIMHDCDTTYFRYPGMHALCGAHLLRDLRAVEEKDRVRWPIHMKKLLTEMVTEKTKPKEERSSYAYYRRRYRSILTKGENETKELKNRHKLSDGKDLKENITSETLLKRMRKYEDAYLRFYELEEVDFTNNLSERNLRHSKNRDKISGCVKNMDSLDDICLIMSYIQTCRNFGLTSEEALLRLFEGNLPEFIDLSQSDPSLFENQGVEDEKEEILDKSSEQKVVNM